MVGSGKVYIAHCPNCLALLKEISPVPLYRCQACKKFLLVKNWKLEKVAAGNENISAEKHTLNDNSETLGLTSDHGSLPKCNEKPMPSDDSNSINIDNEKNEAVGGDISGKPDDFGTQKSASELANSDAISSCDSSTFLHGRVAYPTANDKGMCTSALDNNDVLGRDGPGKLSIFPIQDNASEGNTIEENKQVVEERSSSLSNKHITCFTNVNALDEVEHSFTDVETIEKGQSVADAVKSWEEKDNVIIARQPGNFFTDRGLLETGNIHQESSSYDEATCQTNKVDAYRAGAITHEKTVENREDEEDDLLAKLGNLSLQIHASENGSHPDEESQSEGLACVSNTDPPHTKDANVFGMSLDREAVKRWKDDEECVILGKHDSFYSEMKSSDNRSDIGEPSISYIKDKESAVNRYKDGESSISLGKSDSFSQSSMSENELDFCGLFQSEGEISLREESILCLVDANLFGTTNDEHEETASYHTVEHWQTDQKGGISQNCAEEDEFIKQVPTFADKSMHVSERIAPGLIHAVSSGCDNKIIPSSPEKMTSYSNREHNKFEAGCCNAELTKEAKSLGSLTEASLAYCEDSISIKNDGMDQCLHSETCGKSHAYEKSISSTRDLRSPHILSAVKPVSRRTFRSRKVSSPCNIPADKEEDRSVLLNKNESVLSEAADQEQYFTLSLPSESSDLCWSPESTHSQSNHESSPPKLVPPLPTVEKGENKLLVANQNENVVSEAADQEQHFTSPSLSSESCALCLTTESVLPLCNHESSPAIQARTSHPVDKEENKLFLRSKNENVVSEAADQVEHFALSSSSQSIGSCLNMGSTVFSPSNIESSLTEQDLTSHHVDKEESKAFLVNKNENAVSESDEKQNFIPSSESSGLCLTMERLLSPSYYEPKYQVLTSHSIDGEQSKSFSVNKNENVVSQAADQEQQFTSLSSSESRCLCLNVESIVLSPSNHESSSMKQVLTSNPADKENDKSVSVNKNAVVISEVEEQEQLYTSPLSSSSSESNRLCSTKECVLSPSNHDSSPTKQVLTSHPADMEGKSAMVNKDENVVSDVTVQVKHFTLSLSSSSESSGLCLTLDTVASPGHHESSPTEQIPPSHPENQPTNASSVVYSSENGTKPDNDTPISKTPDSSVHGMAVNQKMDPSATKRRTVNPNHLELLRKIDELKVEITKSIGQRRKGNKPQRTRDASQATEKPLVSNGHSEQERQQLPLSSCQSPLQMATSEKPKHHLKYRRERNQDISRLSPSSSSTSNSPSEAFCSSSGSPTTDNVCSTPNNPVTKASLHTVSSSPHHYHGNHKVARVRRLQKRDKTPVVKRHCRPLLGSAPFIVCYECLVVLQMPEDFHFSRKNRKMQCGACFKVLKLALVDQTHVVPSS